MPLAVTVSRGHTFIDGTPVTTADLNAAALPTVNVTGAVGSGELDDGAITPAKVSPGAYFYALTTGSANAYTATLSPAATSLVAGLWLFIKANHTNTGAATINVNGLGAKSIRKHLDQALEAGDIQNGQVCLLEYDGTNFQLLSEPGMPRTSYATATGGTNAFAVTLADLELNALSDLTGRVVLFKTNAANTGACTLAVNGLTATAIKTLAGGDPVGGDLPSGRVIAVVYDGTAFQLLSGTSSAALPDVVTAATVAYPASLTYDSKGRITGSTAGSAPATRYTSTPAAIPAAGAAVTNAHGLGGVPFSVAWTLVNVTADAGYTTGQEVELDAVFGQASDSQFPAFSLYRDGTNLVARRESSGSSIYVWKADDGVFTAINTSNWQLKVRATT